MSTILKAIDRLEREKQKRNEERPLREEVAQRHVVRGPSRTAKRTLLIALSTGLVLLGGSLVVWFSVGSTSESGTRRAEGRGVRRAAVPEPTVPAGDVAPTRRGDRVPLVAQGDPAPLPAPQQSVPIAPARVRHEPVSEVPGDSVVELKSGPTVAAARIAHETSTGMQGGERPLRRTATPSVSAPPPPALPVAKVTAKPVKTRRAPPREVDAPESASESTRVIRDVVVARTIWHPDGDRRFALIEVSGHLEPLRVSEGDAVGPLLVRKIEPSGVVFLDDGIEIRRRVGGRD